MTSSADVLIVGAGAAGLAAAHALTASGRQVTVLEARDRIGGRIFTDSSSTPQLPIELGAEFVHGCPPEIFNLARQFGLELQELRGEFWYREQGKLCRDEFPSERSAVFERMDKYHGPDLSFRRFLEECCADVPSQEKRWATAYVEGFHAANSGLISVRSILAGEKAEEEIEGERQFRLSQGYAGLVEALRRASSPALCQWQLKHVVSTVRWQPGRVDIEAVSPEGDALPAWSGSHAVITLPLSILQLPPQLPGAVRFEPPLDSKQSALSQLAMGTAVHATLVFGAPFWREPGFAGAPRGLANMLFLFSEDPRFPTWWSKLPSGGPALTAWCAGPPARAYRGQPASLVTRKAVQALAANLGMRREEVAERLESAYVHDWEADPFSRGAYSYVLAGGAEQAQRELAAPLADTLFFAGEATNFQGHHATVHGAMASGYRAAAEVLQTHHHPGSGHGPV